MIKKLFNSLSKNESTKRNRSCKKKETEELIENNLSEHNRSFISEDNVDFENSIITNEKLNYDWTKDEPTLTKMNQVKTTQNKSDSNLSKDKAMDDFFMNLSGISRRKILANIDYDVDGQFMCSTLIKDNEDKSGFKPKFCEPNESNKNATLNDQTKLSNKKLELITKQIQEVEAVQQINEKFYKKQNSVNNLKQVSKSHQLPQKTLSYTHTADSPGRLVDDEEELIYDIRKPFNNLNEETTKLNDLKNNLKNLNQMSSTDKRRIFDKYFNNDGDYNQSANSNHNSIDRNSLIANENLRSEMYNNENSNLINQIKKLQNYHNNQIIHNLNDEDTWFCKTKLYDDTLDEIVKKWNYIDNDIWSKIILFERNRRVAKAYIRLPYLIVTGGDTGFDGYSIGLRGFENIYRDQETEFILKNLEKGIRIKIDEDGNLILRKMTHLSVQIKDWLQQLTEGTGSLSDDVIALHGKIPFNIPTKVFDMDRFANNLRKELEQPVPNRRRLAKQCIIPISFGKSVFNLLNSPSWLMVVNVHGLRMIEKTAMTRIPEPDYGLSTIEDNLNQVCLKEEQTSSGSSCSNGLSDSMNSNSEEYYTSGFTNKNKNSASHIYSSI